MRFPARGESGIITRACNDFPQGPTGSRIMSDTDFSASVLNWHAENGRHNLPWQVDRTPYRVWVSEIMLQQTQVATTIPYYARFIARFPDVQSLAAAPPDEVLHHWSGLGYYARARNLHAAARTICDRHAGAFPLTFDAVAELPGIGRSTAGAILALSTGQRHAILDGNVKRVLARFHGIDGWPGQAAVERELWQRAEQHTPHRRVADYTQAIMDLGATLCTARKPRCGDCPVRTGCVALAEDRVAQLPAPRPTRALPLNRCRMLVLLNGHGEVLLERRPPSGIWGGLWSFPESPWGRSWKQWCVEELRLAPKSARKLGVIRHTFSHFHLDIHPMLAHVDLDGRRVMAADRWVWYNTASNDRRGLPAPVMRLLDQLPPRTKDGV
jgi:A/G-specific adenine glycosylase